MKNYWTCFGDAAAIWEANLAPLWMNPERLLNWVIQVVEAGERFEVMKVVESESLAYHRRRDRSLTDVLHQLYTETGTVDLFFFTGPTATRNGRFETSRVAGKMSYCNELGEICETEVEQLGPLLEKYRPELRDVGVVSPAPPLLACGPSICFPDLSKSRGPYRPDSLRVRFSTYSDVWQPWVQGRLEHNRTWDDKFDNSFLAKRHTPRLNLFLGYVSEMTRSLDCTWEFLSDDSSLSWTKLYCDEGVRLE